MNRNSGSYESVYFIILLTIFLGWVIIILVVQYNSIYTSNAVGYD